MSAAGRLLWLSLPSAAVVYASGIVGGVLFSICIHLPWGIAGFEGWLLCEGGREVVCCKGC